MATAIEVEVVTPDAVIGRAGVPMESRETQDAIFSEWRKNRPRAIVLLLAAKIDLPQEIVASDLLDPWDSDRDELCDVVLYRACAWWHERKEYAKYEV